MKKTASFTTAVLLILLCLAAPISSAWAESQGVATVVALRGTVVALNKSGASRNLSLKSQLFQEDVLKTGNNGKLQIMFTDNSIISLGRDSEMKIAEYRWQPEQKDGALKTQVKEGTFRVMGGALAKDAPQNFKTETPTATIGIRGSMYAFKATQDSLSVVFQGGKGIDVFNDHGKVSITVPGFGTKVLLNAPPAPPVKFTDKQLNDLNSGANGNGGNGDGGNGESGGTGDGGNGESGGTGDGGDGGNEGNNTPPPPPTTPPPPVIPPPNEFPNGPVDNFTQPPAPPTDGVFGFDGVLGGASYNPSTGDVYDTFINSLSFGVNWHNHRIFGVAYDTDGDKPVFFFGSVTGSTVSDLTVFGIDELYQNSDYQSPIPGFISGNGIGVFTGSAYDLFSFAVEGNSYDIQSSALHDTWIAAGGAQKTATTLLSAPTGSSDWKGFVTGLSVEMTDPYNNLVGMYQSGMDGVNITLNKDTGTISGFLNPGNDVTVHFNTLSNLQVGGNTSNSVYVRDDLMAALISGCVGDCTPSTLKTYGNAMVSADPQDQVSTYVTWGYWEIAYTENSTDRIMSPSSSLWIAGKPTSISDMTALNGYKGTYNGKAFGTELSASGAVSLNGTCALTADFTNGWVDGNIALTNPTTSSTINLPLSAVTITSNSFAGSIYNGTDISGEIKGGFFGPAAIATGGNFRATDSNTSKAYLGIFGGDRGALTTSPVN